MNWSLRLYECDGFALDHNGVMRFCGYKVTEKAVLEKAALEKAALKSEPVDNYGFAITVKPSDFVAEDWGSAFTSGGTGSHSEDAADRPFDSLEWIEKEILRVHRERERQRVLDEIDAMDSLAKQAKPEKLEEPEEPVVQGKRRITLDE